MAQTGAAGDEKDLESIRKLARAALTEGLDALGAGDKPRAIRWLERARRLAPQDIRIEMTLASAVLESDPAQAARLFDIVTRQQESREGYLGLATARRRLGDTAAARAILARLLSRYACKPDAVALADTLEPGQWCGLTSAGQLELGAPKAAQVKAVLDGKPLKHLTLPPDWQRARGLEVTLNGAPMIGSPIDIGAIRRIAGCVEARDGGIAGWAVHPNDPDTAPVLTFSSADGTWQRTLRLEERLDPVEGLPPLVYPYRIQLRRDELPGAAPIHVRGPNGRDLPGSPLNPLWDESAHVAAARMLASGVWPHDAAASLPMRADATVPAEPIGADRKRRHPTVVIPVHNGGPAVETCLRGVLGTLDDGAKLIVVDDGSDDPAIIRLLDRLARERKIALLRHPAALGFPAAANAGIQAAKGRDVVLLNSDTLVPPKWLPRLRNAAYSAFDIGTVTPMSNDASILSYPSITRVNPTPNQVETTRLDRQAVRANGAETIEIPVGVGFCLYLRRDCLDATGPFRAELFAQGYAEENDYCLRARRLGWRNVALTGLFVGHAGGASFGSTASYLRARNARLIEQLHPGHDALVASFIRRHPLFEARRRIDLRRWRDRARGWQASAVLITHDHGGGVERRLALACEAQRQAGRRPLVLRHTEMPDGEPAIAVRDGVADDLPNLNFSVPGELPALLKLLRATHPQVAEIHHLANYHPSIYDLVARLDVPYDVHVHDYAWFCPRISLVAGDNRYCGEPDVHECDACVADNGHFLSEAVTTAALRARSSAFLAAARTVVVPSEDTNTRMRRYFPNVRLETIRHAEDEFVPAAPRDPSVRPRICVVGAIGVHKGYHVLLACARDAARRNLDLEFVVVGHTIADTRLIDTGKVFITGEFAAGEAMDLIAAQQAAFGFLPSVWPETWCLALDDLWSSGLNVAAFDLGAPAERIRRTGHGIILPFGLPPAGINNSLIAAIRTAGH